MGSTGSKPPPRLENCVGRPYPEVVHALSARKINIQLVAVKSDEIYDKSNIQRPKFGITIVYDTLTDIVKDIFVF
jgi:hypothetical protein